LKSRMFAAQPTRIPEGIRLSRRSTCVLFDEIDAIRAACSATDSCSRHFAGFRRVNVRERVRPQRLHADSRHQLLGTGPDATGSTLRPSHSCSLVHCSLVKDQVLSPINRGSMNVPDFRRFASPPGLYFREFLQP